MDHNEQQHLFPQLVRGVAPVLAEHGFCLRNSSHFDRWESDTRFALWLQEFKSIEGGGAVTLWFTVGFRKIQQILRSLSFLHIDENALEQPSTLWANGGYLRIPFLYEEWMLSCEEDVEIVRRSIVCEFLENGLAFFRRYRTVEDLIAESSACSTKYIAMTHRPTVFAAGYWLLGKHSRAIQIYREERDRLAQRVESRSRKRQLVKRGRGTSVVRIVGLE